MTTRPVYNSFRERTHKTYSANHGITVIELVLTVAALLLAIAAIPSIYRSFVIKLHDAERLRDIEELRSALHIYYLYNGTYPIAEEPEKISGIDKVSQTLKQSFLVLGTRLPIDPDSPQRDYIYRSYEGGKNYAITYCLQNYRDETHTPDCNNKGYPKPIVWPDTR